ncbi:DivIVA domain-containing protein [Schaalia sp. 19OD2882]|uniref:DivIVA domain-containing protein n=1 Tax=Schaalia sp. 19OD2882 TaxID=2794089 RepID=UPI001C1EC260|nr:DivIVA domain-containing protein [Schaalia sp. 19OD2882]QWW18934.1 DivIVA domain-containing protein [Schaalia sp. 19OD2882]
MALLTTEDVLNKKFQYVKFREGYDQVEVDEFLDEVVSTIYTLQAENQDLKEKLEAAERRIAELSAGDVTQVRVAGGEGVDGNAELAAAQARITQLTAELEQARSTPVTGVGSPESATSMLALAQRVHDEYVRDGREESERIIAEARGKGDEIVADAQRQHETILGQLDQERGLLETKINELRSFESEYRSNLRSHLESLLGEVNAGQQG